MSHIVIARQCDLWQDFFLSLRSNSLYVAPSRLQLSDVIYYWYSVVVVCGIFKSQLLQSYIIRVQYFAAKARNLRRGLAALIPYTHLLLLPCLDAAKQSSDPIYSFQSHHIWCSNLFKVKFLLEVPIILVMSKEGNFYLLTTFILRCMLARLGNLLVWYIVVDMY